MKRKIVIKIGTNGLTRGGFSLSRRHLLGLIQQIVHLQDKEMQIILVCSGAVACGKDFLNNSDECSLRQSSAAVGQVELIGLWAELCFLFELKIAQLLLTGKDFENEKRKENVQNVVRNLLANGIMPIINENDVVGNEGDCFRDNDHLAALVAEALEADDLIILTDQEGVFTADPRTFPGAKFIPVIKHVDQEFLAVVAGSSSLLGKGGMLTKLQAAQSASRLGIRTIIASSFRHNVLIDLFSGQKIGTLFLEETHCE